MDNSRYDINDQLTSDFYRDVLELLPYEPNQGQVEAFAAFAHFLFYGDERSVLLLNGYAGTGKTSLMGAVVQALSRRNIKVVLLAPTGRAAQVLSEYSQRTALTIHRKIYRQDSYLSDGFSLAENKHTSTVFIVDEASMISNSQADMSMFGSGRLLDDLVAYVYNGQGCKLMLMGDGAQLPPVGQSESPALSSEVMKRYGLTVYDVTMTQIARQAADSGILQNATLVRQILTSGQLVVPKLELSQYPDIEAITGEFLLETLSDCKRIWLEEVRGEISGEDFIRAEYVIGEMQRVLDVCDALERDDYETVGEMMYQTHFGMSKLYEVSCEELDFLNKLARKMDVTGSRVMGGGFGGCTINLVKDELYAPFVEAAKKEFTAKFGHAPKVYDVVISDGARKL